MQTNDQTAQREAGSAPAHGSAKVIVYAGKHYGQPHYVVGRHSNGRELMVWHVEDAPGKAFRVNVCDTETLSPNDPSSATRRTGRDDCNRDAPAGFAAAHG